MSDKKAAGYANTQTAHTQTTHRDSIIVRHAPHWRETLAANLSEYRVEGGPTAPSTRGLRRAYDAMLRRAKKRHAKRGARHG